MASFSSYNLSIGNSTDMAKVRPPALTTTSFPTPTKSQSYFQKLPLELLIRIFRPHLVSTDYRIGRHKTPPLLIALRPSQEHYRIALQLYYRGHAFYIGTDNCGFLTGLHEGIFKLIVYLFIDVRSWARTWSDLRMSPTWQPSKMLLATHLRRLRISTRAGGPLTFEIIQGFLRSKKLRVLIVCVYEFANDNTIKIEMDKTIDVKLKTNVRSFAYKVYGHHLKTQTADHTNDEIGSSWERELAEWIRISLVKQGEVILSIKENGRLLESTQVAEYNQWFLDAQ